MDEIGLLRNIKNAQKGDEEAFAALISVVQNKAYAIAYRYMENDADTRDAMQEAFIKMYRSLGSFQGQSSFETWFTRILINCCLDELRRKKSRGASEDIEEHYSIRDESPGPEAAAVAKERQELLQNALRQLPEDFKNIILLREFQGLSYEELAEVLEIEAGTVKSRLSRAKKKLKEILVEQNPGVFV